MISTVDIQKIKKHRKKFRCTQKFNILHSQNILNSSWTDLAFEVYPVRIQYLLTIAKDTRSMIKCQFDNNTMKPKEIIDTKISTIDIQKIRFDLLLSSSLMWSVLQQYNETKRISQYNEFWRYIHSHTVSCNNSYWKTSNDQMQTNMS